MKKIYIIFFIVMTLSIAATSSFASDNPPANPNSSSEIKITVVNPAEKLSRGIVNIITAPIEIAKQVDLSWKESAHKTQNVGTGIFSGIVKGLAYMVWRAGSGLWDVVSFPFKTPANYEPLMKPEFVLDK